MKLRDINLELRGQPVDLKPGMVSANSRNGMATTADRLPIVYRDGALDAEKLPSRIGSRLHYPGGRVVDLHAEWADRDARLAEEYRAGFDAPFES